MNKIQYIKLLAMRGLTELHGVSVAEAVRQTGGDPSVNEMVKVNEECMIHYFDKFEKERLEKEKLEKIVSKLEDRDNFLRCLEAAGVDNWDGYDIAIEIRDENN